MTFLVTCFVGDSITLGTADAACLGWPARLAAAELARGHELTVYNLGVRANTTTQIAQRWRPECAARLPDLVPGGVVFNFGTNDTRQLAGGGVELTLDQSLANARAMVADAASWKPVLWVGQVPVYEPKQPLRSLTGAIYHFTNERVRQWTAAYAALAGELAVPFLDLYTSLVQDGAWNAQMALGDSVHPTATGYAMIAERVAAWPAWRSWLDG
ncbi:MAG: hypothetical protein FJX56_06100 [Alphaproteobacteria bacterium]|nr:hypothetical protein [Alphaproteobacteria bacterium]